jgi:hypothetical protein
VSEAEMTEARQSIWERWRGRHWPHSWAELATAVERDRRCDLMADYSLTCEYDRRVLLNVVAYLLDAEDALNALIKACRDPLSGHCYLCQVPPSTMHEPECPVLTAIRVLNPAFDRAMEATE